MVHSYFTIDPSESYELVPLNDIVSPVSALAIIELVDGIPLTEIEPTAMGISFSSSISCT